MIRQPRYLRHPLAHKVTLRVVLQPILYWIIHPYRIRPRCARLHLKLRVVNPRLVIQKILRQMIHPQPPINVQMMRQKTHQHRPHPKIDPPRSRQCPHVRIHQGIPRLTLLPSLQQQRIVLRTQILKGPVHRPIFIRTLLLKLLYEVIMPLDARQKCRYRPTVFLLLTKRFRGLINLLNRQITPSDVNR